MTSRVGRSFAQHTYPRGAQGAGALPALARNFASGPEDDFAVVMTSEPIPWDFVEDGASGVDIPITPQSTGIVQVTGEISIRNSAEGTRVVSVSIWVDGVQVLVPTNFFTTAPDEGRTVISFHTQIPLLLPIGVEADVQVQIAASTADAILVVAGSSTVSIQEVVPATG